VFLFRWQLCANLVVVLLVVSGLHFWSSGCLPVIAKFVNLDSRFGLGLLVNLLKVCLCSVRSFEQIWFLSQFDVRKSPPLSGAIFDEKVNIFTIKLSRQRFGLNFPENLLWPSFLLFRLSLAFIGLFLFRWQLCANLFWFFRFSSVPVVAGFHFERKSFIFDVPVVCGLHFWLSGYRKIRKFGLKVWAWAAGAFAKGLFLFRLQFCANLIFKQIWCPKAPPPFRSNFLRESEHFHNQID
jgi:hypothetical protein